MDYKELECIKKLNELVDECISEKEAKNVLSYKPKSLTELDLNNIQNTIKKLEDENRLLQIGIVGAVKAGKSTFLNSLIFDGKDVLPKAATPMTAALTIIKYGEFGARVELFSDNDITIIKNKALDSNDKDNPSKQQYEKIKNSNIKDISQIPTEIKADSFDELNEKLKEYVGADGKYTPFVKHVELSLKDEKLKDIQIVDTPGINDPVTSREEVTKKELQNCDVVFILSTATQFLSNADLELLNRISHKEGIREVYFVASKFDNALRSISVIGESDHNLILAKKNEIKKLEEARNEKILSSKILSEEIKEELRKNKLLFSSGLAYSIAKKLEDKEELNSEEAKNIERFKEAYPEFFSDDSIQGQYSNLHGVDEIKMALENVRQDKDKIKKDKIENFLSGKINTFYEYIYKELKQLGIELNALETEDLETNKEKIENLSKEANRIKTTLYKSYSDFIRDTIEHIEQYIREELQCLIEGLKININTETKMKDSFWSFITDGKYLVLDGVSINKYFGSFRSGIDRINKEIKNHHLSKMREEVYKKINKAIDIDSCADKISKDRIEFITNEILDNMLKYPPLSNNSDIELPNVNNYIYKKEGAESKLKDIQDCLNLMYEKIIEKRDNETKTIKNRLTGDMIADDIVEQYLNEIKTLQSDLQNKEQSIEFIEKYQYKFRKLRSLI